jgi:ferric-dicitrate binding protein FerR (iron transport regulator)
VSRHVAPHRFADAIAGRLGEPERAAIDRHVAACASCAKAQERVARASGTFPALRAQTAPDIAWDAVRARVHWAVSTERRARIHPRPRGLSFIGWAAAAGVLVAATLTGSVAPRRAPGDTASVATASPPHVAPASERPAALVGLVSRLAGDVLVDGLRSSDPFARRITAGTVLATADGRIDVQFGDASAFALGPRSTLELRRFDAASIELVVDGTVDVVVAPRAADQRFVVIAGAHVIEVRGTQFRVAHDGAATRVECRHGAVAVRAGTSEVIVGAARGVDAAPSGFGAIGALSADALARLERGTPATMPLWDPAAIAATSAPLEIAGRTADVRVDGVELGRSPLRVRVMPGRHTVEAADRAGRYRRVGWVDVKTVAARVDVPAETAPNAAAATRKRELHAGIDQSRRARLAACTRDVAAAGAGRTYVEIEIGVDAAGAIGFLNIVETELGQTTQRCVHDVLADVRFGAGPAASWRERIEL